MRRLALLVLLPVPALAAPERLELEGDRIAVVDGAVARTYVRTAKGFVPPPGRDLTILKNGPDATARYLGRLESRKGPGEVRFDLREGDAVTGSLTVRATGTEGRIFPDDDGAIRSLSPGAGSLLVRAGALHDRPAGLRRLPEGWIDFRPSAAPLPAVRPAVRPPSEPRPPDGAIPILPIAAGVGGLFLGLGLGALLFHRRAQEPVRASDPVLDGFRAELRRVAPRDLVGERTYPWALGEIAAAARLRAELSAIPPADRRTAAALAEAEAAAGAAWEREAAARREAERLTEESRRLSEAATAAATRETAAIAALAGERAAGSALADALAGVARAFGVEATSSEAPAAIVERLRQRAVATRADDEAEDRRLGLARDLLDRTEELLDDLVRPADPEATAPFEAMLRFAVGETALALAQGDEEALGPALLNLRALADGAARREGKPGSDRYAEFVRGLGDPPEPALAPGPHRHAVSWGGRVLAVRTGRFPISGFSRLYVRGKDGTYRIAPPA